MNIKRLFTVLIAFALVLTGCPITGAPVVESLPSPSLNATPPPSEPEPEIEQEPKPEPEPLEPEENSEEAAEMERLLLLAAAVEVVAPMFDESFPVEDFLLWLDDVRHPGSLAVLSGSSGDFGEIGSMLWDWTGETLNVIKDRWNGLLDSPETARAAGIFFPRNEGTGKTVLAFAGDVGFQERYVIQTYRSKGQGMAGVLTGGILEDIRAADVFLVNNECPFTNRGTAIPGKLYTFRASPDLVSLHEEMGTGVALLANNHTFDYNADGLEDTLKTFDDAGIPRIGAGKDIDEAARPVYYIVNGRKFAFINMNCIERYVVRSATADLSGVFCVYVDNTERLIASLQEAAENSDYVVAIFHWGIQYTTNIEPYQRELAQICIDNGADAVVGGHPHVLQGTEFYMGKPIVYSLGNFWFTPRELYSGVLQLMIGDDGGVSVRLIPCLTGNGVTSKVEGDRAGRILAYYESISFNVTVDSDGYIAEKQG